MSEEIEIKSEKEKNRDGRFNNRIHGFNMLQERIYTIKVLRNAKKNYLLDAKN